VGKTRLSLQSSLGVVEAFPDGVCLVELAPLADPDLVPYAAAEALGVREQPGRTLLATLVDSLRTLLATLVDSLRTRRLLLLLDNCEHLITAVAAPPISDVIGQARLWRAGRSVRMVLRASGFDPGVAYTAWLGYQDSSSTCFAGTCGDEGRSSATSGGRMRQIAGVATTPYRELDVDVSLHDLEPASGTQVSLVLLRPGGRAGPHAQVAFTIP